MLNFATTKWLEVLNHVRLGDCETANIEFREFLSDIKVLHNVFSDKNGVPTRGVDRT